MRAALKEAARSEQCDFPGFGLHSLRRANITWRQEVGGSSIEASRIAGHASTKMTEEYTVVQLNRQDELTRRIQMKLAAVSPPHPVATPTQPEQNSLALSSDPDPECDATDVGAEKGSDAMAISESDRASQPDKETSNQLKPKPSSKKELVLKLLRRKNGASLAELTAETDWQPHSVRGFLSANVRKAMGLKVLKRAGKDGTIRYRLKS